KFILYTILGTAATFAILLHMSLLPHLEELPAFAGGITPKAVLGELPSFLITLAVSWIAWWSVSGILSLVLYSLGKYTNVALFVISLAAIFGITTLIT
ncbi:MAG: hypothetical protein LIP28_01395, partial [Deltaproteobacteria bacterium]|nr:hypothetical protein [Deltaproteobacteria bacterium]